MTKPARFFALMPVRDEADIVGQTLTAQLQWADKIFVFDTGSVDHSYDIVLDMAGQDDRIHPLGTCPVYFNDTKVRGLIFERARDHMRDGDWFLRCDADEFHHIPPPQFVAEKLSDHESQVYHQYYDFALTHRDVAAWEAGTETVHDRQKPIHERRTRYTVSTYAEPRLFRYRSSMKWPGFNSMPFNSGLVATARLPIRHYPHRDPAQLQRRAKLRAMMMSNSVNAANWGRISEHHWTAEDWRDLVLADDDARLNEWLPGTDLPDANVPCPAVKTGTKRLLQRALYQSGAVRLLDHRRAGWEDDRDAPLPIEPEMQAVLAAELKTHD